MTARTATTDDEKQAVNLLRRCGFAPASWDKRFVGQLSDAELSEKERPQVWRLFIRYRRQIQAALVTSANRQTRLEQATRFQTLLHHAAIHAAPDFRRQAAAAKK